MARDPGSLWSPLPESGKQGTHVKTQCIIHSTGDRGSAAAIFGYFSRAAVVVESTFVIGLSADDPTRQLLDTCEVADANLTANGPAVSIEVVGRADDPLTDWQIAELIRIGRWLRTVHPIEARQCPSSTASGFGWHVMFGSPGPWTPVAKDCPGPVRIKQLQQQVFPAIFASEEDVMTPGQIEALNECRRMLGVLLLWNEPATENERQALKRIYGDDVPAVALDPSVIAAALPPDIAKQVADLLVARLAD